MIRARGYNYTLAAPMGAEPWTAGVRILEDTIEELESDIRAAAARFQGEEPTPGDPRVQPGAPGAAPAAAPSIIPAGVPWWAIAGGALLLIGGAIYLARRK